MVSPEIDGGVAVSSKRKPEPHRLSTERIRQAVRERASLAIGSVHCQRGLPRRRITRQCRGEDAWQLGSNQLGSLCVLRPCGEYISIFP